MAGEGGNHMTQMLPVWPLYVAMALMLTGLVLLFMRVGASHSRGWCSVCHQRCGGGVWCWCCKEQTR